MSSDLEQLVERWQRENAELRAENDRLRQQVVELTARIEELERAAARQAAPFRREERSKVPAGEQKRPGRKPGHPGFYRQQPRQVDQEIDVPLPACPQCGGV